MKTLFVVRMETISALIVGFALIIHKTDQVELFLRKAAIMLHDDVSARHTAHTAAAWQSTTLLGLGVVDMLLFDGIGNHGDKIGTIWRDWA